LVVDINGIIIRTNMAFNRMFHLNDEEVVGKEIKEIFGNAMPDIIEAVKECSWDISSFEIALPDGKKSLCQLQR
jgi:PAS domain S-box-containing protein